MESGMDNMESWSLMSIPDQIITGVLEYRL